MSPVPAKYLTEIQIDAKNTAIKKTITISHKIFRFDIHSTSMCNETKDYAHSLG